MDIVDFLFHSDSHPIVSGTDIHLLLLYNYSGDLSRWLRHFLHIANRKPFDNLSITFLFGGSGGFVKPQPCRNRSVNGAYETAARRGTTPAALRREAEEEEAWKAALCEAVVTLAKEAETLPLRVSYAEVTERFGADVFGGKQPKRALEAVLGELHEQGMRVETGVKVYQGSRQLRGFGITNKTISDNI